MAAESAEHVSAPPDAAAPVAGGPGVLARALPVIRGGPAARGSIGQALAYGGLLAYYILIQNFLDPRGVVERFSPTYFALVLPVLAYVASQWRAIVTPRDRAAHWMLAFAIAVALLAVVRWDFSNLPRAALTALVAAAVLGSRSAVPVKWLNALFLVSIPAAIVTDLIGTNVFGLIPNQATGCGAVEPWRVSLFPLVPESAFLALFVLTLNLLFNRTATGYAVSVLATYVLLFSSLRTAILALALVLGFLILRRLVSMRHRLVYASYFVACAGLVALTAHTGLLLALIPKFDVGYLNIYLYRSASGIESTQELRQTVYRSAVWDYHFGVFFDYFPLGRGAELRQTRMGEGDARTETSALESVVHRPLSVDCRPASQLAEPPADRATPETSKLSAGRSAPVETANTQSGSSQTPNASRSNLLPTQGTLGAAPVVPKDGGPAGLSQFCLGCSFFTGWIASVGVAAVFLILFLASLVTRAITDENPALFAASLIFFPLAMFWGVLLVPYNVIFILFLGCAYLSADVASAQQHTRLGE